MSTLNVDRKKYGGKYIATRTFTSSEILAFGKNPTKVYNKAIEQGVEEPVINFVHKDGDVCLY